VTLWTQIQGAAGWTQWADIAQADECIAVAADWTSPQMMASVINDPVQQRTIGQNALRAIGAAFQSLNLPPLAWPQYRILFNQYYGNVTLVQPSGTQQRSMWLGGGTIGTQKIPRALAGSDQAQAVAQCALSPSVTLVLDHLDESGGVYVEKDYLIEYGSFTGGLFTWNVLTNRRDPLVNPPNLTAQSLATILGHPSTLDWGTIAWQSGANINTNIGLSAAPQGPSAPCWLNVILYPYVWQLDFVNDLITAWQNVGAAQ
jgi:hypothetical protein